VKEESGSGPGTSESLPASVGDDLEATLDCLERNDDAVASAADITTVGVTDINPDELQTTGPSLCVLCEPNSLQDQSEDDSNVDEVQPNDKTSESEVGTLAHDETPSADSQKSDQELFYDQDQLCETSEHLEQDEQYQTLDQQFETSYTYDERETLAVQWLTSDRPCRVVDVTTEDFLVKCETLRRSARRHQSVDRECQTLDDGRDRVDNRQRHAMIDTQDVHCQTARDEVRRLSSRQVQTDDNTTGDSATSSTDTATGVDDVQQPSPPATTTSDANIVEVLNYTVAQKIRYPFLARDSVIYA